MFWYYVIITHVFAVLQVMTTCVPQVSNDLVSTRTLLLYVCLRASSRPSVCVSAAVCLYILSVHFLCPSVFLLVSVRPSVRRLHAAACLFALLSCLFTWSVRLPFC